MCIASVIHDYYNKKWESPTPNILSSFPYPDREAVELMRKLLELAEKIDKKLGDVICTDPKKAETLDKLLRYLDKSDAK